MIKILKRIIIRWAIKKIKTLNMSTEVKSYRDLGKYGIADILENKETGEAMYIFD